VVDGATSILLGNPIPDEDLTGSQKTCCTLRAIVLLL
jgi:hypothetical protein